MDVDNNKENDDEDENMNPEENALSLKSSER